MTRDKQEFAPIDGKTVRIYSCGPTVYSSPTIGNLRAYVFTDILKKSLKNIGKWGLFDVLNVTDVGHLQSDSDEGEDKVEIAAKRAQLSPAEITKKYTAEFTRDTALLNIAPPKVLSPATQYIREMISHIAELEKLGFTYDTSDGVYFDAFKFPDYEKLRRGDNLSPDSPTISRIALGEKRGKNDFCLWRKSKPTALQKFPSPWGDGTPGWHIECSAIARRYLGDEFDIHTGGVDHIPIHHTNERAQTEALTNRPMSRFWMHNEFIKINNTKMSKSLGNAYTLTDITDKGYASMHFRYLCLLTHYRTIMNFTWESLDSAKKSYENLVKTIKKNKLTEIEIAALRKEFQDAITDDLNTAKAIAVLWRADVDLALEYDAVLSLGLREAIEKFTFGLNYHADKIPADVIALANKRLEFKKARDFLNADKLRDEIKSLGYEVLDTKEGYEIRKLNV